MKGINQYIQDALHKHEENYKTLYDNNIIMMLNLNFQFDWTGNALGK